MFEPSIPTSNRDEIVRYVDLVSQWREERDEILHLIDQVASTGLWVSGPHVETLEKDLASLCDSNYARALNSGTDSLVMAMHCLGIGAGDEVITPGNSFIASTASIVHLGARPVLADVGDDYNIDVDSVQGLVTSRTKAIMCVHLTGRMADIKSLKKVVNEHGLFLVEDSAQAVGARRDGITSGSAGDFGCFSTHPLKNLNALGDGGFVTTSREEFAVRIGRLRSHGLKDRDTSDEFGYVSRLDEIQAAIIQYRLSKLGQIVERRRAIAKYYEEEFLNTRIQFVPERLEEFNTYHTFVVRVGARDDVRHFMEKRGIETNIHYPKPIHRQPAFNKLFEDVKLPKVEEQANEILSIPVHQYLTDAQVEHVASTLKDAVNRVRPGVNVG